MSDTPSVGQGATVHMPRDTYGYVVTAVSPSGSKVTLARLRLPRKSTGHQPARHHNGFPVWAHEYTEEELTEMRHQDQHVEHVYRRGDGRYYRGGCLVTFGVARYFRDYSD